MKLLFPWILLLLAFGVKTQGAELATSREEQLHAALQVHEIFSAKCLDCHSAQLPRPKGKFGYVLDLKRVADKPEFVVKGKPEESELYRLIAENEMPGDDAKVPALTDKEKESVKRWIEIGAPAELPALPQAAAPVEIADEVAPALPFWKLAFRWVGRFHPVSTHFPVALLNVAVFAELLAWWSRRNSWLPTVRFLVVIGAMGAVGAASLGWLNAWFTSYVGQSANILFFHRWLGTLTAVWAAICAGLLLFNDCQEGSKERTRFRGALLVGAFLVGITGFLGSALIYGLDHYRWN